MLTSCGSVLCIRVISVLGLIKDMLFPGFYFHNIINNERNRYAVPWDNLRTRPEQQLWICFNSCVLLSHTDSFGHSPEFFQVRILMGSLFLLCGIFQPRSNQALLYCRWDSFKYSFVTPPKRLCPDENTAHKSLIELLKVSVWLERQLVGVQVKMLEDEKWEALGTVIERFVDQSENCVSTLQLVRIAECILENYLDFFSSEAILH